MDYKIADITEKENEAIKKAEDLVKKETGKDYVLIAWENKQ
ncbi:MAG: hypothetical protein SPJ62_09905 [Inconstantimicrobium porci]|nr:hypothetical protein [Inconstantimicrobium porci]MDD6769520.1 hypothetical protein [Inconstantimicrobium porci]MDY5912297.1 hypothetical protein [Inconstantimicrobium porci]